MSYNAKNARRGENRNERKSKDERPNCTVTIGLSPGSAVYDTTQKYQKVSKKTDGVLYFQAGRNQRSKLPKYVGITVGDLSPEAYKGLCEHFGCRPDQGETTDFQQYPAPYVIHQIEVSNMKDLCDTVNDVLRSSTVDVTGDEELNFHDLYDDVKDSSKVSEADSTNLFQISLQLDGKPLKDTVDRLMKQSFVVSVDVDEDENELFVIVKPDYNMITFFINAPNSRTSAWGLGQDKDKSKNYTSNPNSWLESISAVLKRLVEPRVDYTQFQKVVQDSPVNVTLAMNDLVHLMCKKLAYRNGTPETNSRVQASNTADKIVHLLTPYMVKDGNEIKVGSKLASLISTLGRVGVLPETKEGRYTPGKFMNRIRKIYLSCSGVPEQGGSGEFALKNNKKALNALNALVNYQLPFRLPESNSVVNTYLVPVQLDDEIQDEQTVVESEDEDDTEVSQKETVVVYVHQLPSAAMKAANDVLKA